MHCIVGKRKRGASQLLGFAFDGKKGEKMGKEGEKEGKEGKKEEGP